MPRAPHRRTGPRSMYSPSEPGNPAGRFPSRGFTLVELLVALLLLALVLSLVYGAFGQISSAALQQRDELTEQQDLRLAATGDHHHYTFEALAAHAA